MKIPNYFRSAAHAISVTIVGAGGTGSMLLRQLAAVHIAMLAKGSKGLLVTCVDHDIVSAANLGRQLFTKEDIGRPKAVVLIERINRFYGTSWCAIPFAFTKQIAKMPNFPGNIIVTCVDNVKARKAVYNYFSNLQLSNSYLDTVNNYYWIDTGNTFDTGQIVLQDHRIETKSIFEMFPNIVKNEVKDNAPSCSLAEALGKQSLFINVTIALNTASLIWDITQLEELNYRGFFINLNRSSPIKKIPL